MINCTLFSSVGAVPPYHVQVAIGSFGYGYSPLHLFYGISFLVKACAKVNELFDMFQGAPLYIIPMLDWCRPITLT